MEQITAVELRVRLENNEDVIIIDVREQWEYEEVKLHSTARNFPLGNLPQSLGQLSDLKSTSFIVHCKSGVRSNQAQKYLIKNGFPQVINLVGGIDSYLTQ